MAAAAGVLAARMAAGGARISDDVVGGEAGFAAGLGGAGVAKLGGFGALPAVRERPRPPASAPVPAVRERRGRRRRGGESAPDERPAVAENWIKPWACCLLAHSALEAAARARAAGDGTRADSAIEVTVHPVARRAAPYDDVTDGLQAKFSIPTSSPTSSCMASPSAELRRGGRRGRAVAARVRVRTDPSLLESEARLALDGRAEVRVEASRGSPARPLREDELEAKLETLGAET